MPTFAQIKSAFYNDGWALRREANGSLYFHRFEGNTLPRKEVHVRISDHALGSTVYGEDQGLWLALDIILSDFDDNVTAQDFIEIANNRDVYHEFGVLGIAPSTDPEDWSEALEAAE